MKFLFALWISKLAAWAIRLIDKRKGSNYSGYIACKIDQHFVSGFKGIDPDKVIFITGTNGKSGTMNLMAHIMESAGCSVACNREGANLYSGLATVLLKNSSLTGRFNKDYLVFECDERNIPKITKALKVRHIGVTNLEKDQVQRNGEPDYIVRMFEKAFNKDMTLYLNAQEPRTLALGDKAGRVVTYAVKPNSATREVKNALLNVGMPCPHCGGRIRFEYLNLLGVGNFHCPSCGYKSVQEPDVVIDSVDYANKTFVCSGREWKAAYARPFDIYNCAMVIAIARDMDLKDEQIVHGFETFYNPTNRLYEFEYAGKKVHYLLGKQEDPETFQPLWDQAANDPAPKSIVMGIGYVYDWDPNYQPAFYIWDTDPAGMVQSNITDFHAFGKGTAYDVVNWFVMHGGDPAVVGEVYEDQETEKVLDLIRQAKTDNVYFIYETMDYKVFLPYLKGEK